MRKTMFKKLFFVIFSAVVFLMFCGCGPLTSTVVQLNRERYTPQINPANYSSLQGKVILFDSIEDKSTNTVNLAYFNPEKTVGYQLFYSSQHTLSQPVVSFFWYSLKKGFEHAGIKIIEGGPIYDAELLMTINSLTDEEIRFNILLTQKGKAFCRKDYVVTVQKATIKDQEFLERRAYSMLDSIIHAMLTDKNFQEAFL